MCSGGPSPTCSPWWKLPPESKSASKVKSLSPYPKTWSLKMMAITGWSWDPHARNQTFLQGPPSLQAGLSPYPKTWSLKMMAITGWSWDPHARNQTFLQGPPSLQANNGESLFRVSAGQPKKKRKLLEENRIVHLEVGGHKVHCLMFGQRPTRSDLAILLDANHLEPVILHFRNAGPANLQAKKWPKGNDDTD